jgi:hypothetical protein
MKRNDNGDFCVLYVEPSDEKATVVQAMSEQKKPVVIMLAEQARVFQRPEDFHELKHMKRQLSVPFVFVMPGSGYLAQMAARHGFPVYPSMDALSDALAAGQLVRHRAMTRSTMPLGSAEPESVIELAAPPVMPRRTVPLQPREADAAYKRTVPLTSSTSTTASSSSGPMRRVPPPPNAGTSASSSGPMRRVPPPPSMVPPVAPPAASLPVTPPAAPEPLILEPQEKKRSSQMMKIVALLVTIIVGLAGLGTFLVLYLPDMMDAMRHNNQTAATPSGIVGHFGFLSSEQLSENSNQGIDDEVLVDLSNVRSPAPQKSYYAWLLSDKSQSDTKSLQVGTLQVHNGNAHLLYPGDAKHTNLLVGYSRLLVTEEDATMPPITPSPDYATWRFYGEISSVPINAPDNVKHFSFLDHLRHLLAADPTLDEMELPGGLNTWLYRNASKLVEWTSSMRETWEDSKDIGFVRRQTTRTLTYLDGVSYVQQDLAPNTPLLVNERLARVGLLEVNGPTQDPPGYLGHVVKHLNGLLEAPGAPSTLRKNTAAIVMAMNDVEFWLAQLRRDAQKIMKMSDTQLRQPATLSLINDMISNAQNAFVGQIDPATGQMREGVDWIHDHMQFLATFDITTNLPSKQSIQMIPGQKQVLG